MSDSNQSQPQGSPRQSPGAPDPYARIAALEAQMAQRDAQMAQYMQQQIASQVQAAVAQSTLGSSSSPSPIAPMPRIKPATMWQYAGTGATMGSDLDRFIRDLEVRFDYFGASEFPSDASRIKFAIVCLTSVAADWWHQRTAADKAAITTWSAFVECMQARFRPRLASEAAREKLYVIKQRGSVSAYCSHYQSLLSQVEDMSVRDQITHFILGLADHEVQKDVKKAKCTTLHAAMDAAVAAESYTRRATATDLSHGHRPVYMPGSAMRPQGAATFAAPASSATSSHVPMDLNVIREAADADEAYASDMRHDGLDATDDDRERSSHHRDVLLSSPSVDMRLIDKLVQQQVEARLASLQSPAPRQRRNIFSPEKEKLYKEGKCFKCKKPGHQSRKCPEKDF